MDNSNSSSSNPASQDDTGQPSEANSTRKRMAITALIEPDNKREFLSSALWTVGGGAAGTADDVSMASMLTSLGVSSAQVPELLADQALHQHLTNLYERGTKAQPAGEPVGQEPPKPNRQMQWGAPEVLGACESLCVLYRRLLALKAAYAPQVMSLAARSLLAFTPGEWRTEQASELQAACLRWICGDVPVKTRDCVTHAYFICSHLLSTASVPVGDGAATGQAQEPSGGESQANASGNASVAANEASRQQPEAYALSLLATMFKDINLPFASIERLGVWTQAICKRLLDAYFGKGLSEGVYLMNHAALERLLRSVSIFQKVPFERYLVWHDLLQGMRRRLRRRNEDVVLPAQLGYWVQVASVHQKTNLLPVLVERYIGFPEARGADAPYRTAGLDALMSVLFDLEPGQIPGMSDVLERVFAALDIWDMKHSVNKAQLLVRAARHFPPAAPDDQRSRQTQLLRKALVYCLADDFSPSPSETSMVTRLVPDLMALPPAIRLEWLERFLDAVGVVLPPHVAVLGAGPSTTLQEKDVAQALTWLSQPSLGPLVAQMAAVTWIQLMLYAPASQIDALARGLVARVIAIQAPKQNLVKWLPPVQGLFHSLGRRLQGVPAPRAQNLMAAIVKELDALASAKGARGRGAATTGRWLLEVLNGYQVALGREQVQCSAFSPMPPKAQCVFQAWPRLQIQRPSECSLWWSSQGASAMSPVELGRTRLTLGGFWAEVLSQEAVQVKSAIAPISGLLT